jgi:hypothetical protein
MKKYLSILALVALASSAMAQGTINFVNDKNTWVKVGSSYTDSAAAALSANGGFVQLVWAPAGTAFSQYNPQAGGTTLAAWLSANTGWSVLTSSLKAVGPTSGRFNAGSVTVPTSTPGATIECAVIGWTGTAATFDDAVNNQENVGMSGMFSVKTGDPTKPIPDTATPIVSSGYAGVVLAPIPEPTSFALAGLGAAALLIFRRRK